MRSFQLILHRCWDRVDNATLVPWDGRCLQDLSWWLDPYRLQEGVSLAQVPHQPRLLVRRLGRGLGGHLEREVVSNCWSPEDASLSINARELLAVERGLLHFLPLLVGSTVAIFADNSTAVVYLRNSGVDSFCVSQRIEQRILCWAESRRVVLAPQFIMGQNNVLADAPSRPNQIQGSVWTLKMEVFDELWYSWPVRPTSLPPQPIAVVLSIFLLSGIPGSGDRCAAPWLGPSPGVCVPSVDLDSSGPSQAPLIVRRLGDPDSAILASTSLVSRCSGSGSGSSDRPSSLSRSSQIAALPSSSSRGPQAVASCVGTVQRFARAAGFSASVAAQVGLARHPSSRTNFQLKWLVCRNWCRSEGHFISRPSLPKMADFLLWLHRLKGISVSSFLGYRSMLSAVFRSALPVISSDPVLKDLIRSFKVRLLLDRFVLRLGICQWCCVTFPLLCLSLSICLLSGTSPRRSSF